MEPKSGAGLSEASPGSHIGSAGQRGAKSPREASGGGARLRN